MLLFAIVWVTLLHPLHRWVATNNLQNHLYHDYNNYTITKNVDAENVRQLAFVLAYFNNTYFVCMSVLETRISEARRLSRSMQARFGPWNLDLQKLWRIDPQNSDMRELPKLSGWSVQEQDQDSILSLFQLIFSTLTLLFIRVCFFEETSDCGVCLF